MTEQKKIMLIDSPGSEEGAANFLRKLAKSDDPLALVRELSSHDLLIAHKEADDEQRAELMQMANRDQYQGVVDLDCWTGDKLNLGKLIELMRPLVESGLEGSQEAFDRLDNELKTLLLKQYVIVHVREDKDDEVPANEESELIACSDRFYFIEIPNPDDLPSEVRQIINGLLYKSFDEYHRELEAVKHDLQSEMEETAFKWRNGRLADLGFASRHESQAILSPRDPKQVIRMIKEADKTPYPLRTEITVPAVFRENLSGAMLLDESLRLLSKSENPAFVERAAFIGAELSALTSLYLTSVGCDLGDFLEIGKHTRIARDILSLGLSAVSGDDPDEGARALGYQVPTVIFQAGMGLLVPARGRALALLKDPRNACLGRPGELLDAPYYIVVDLLRRPVPMRWPALDDGRDLSPSAADPLPSELCAFSKVSELESALRLLAEAEYLGSSLAGLGWKFASNDTTEDILGSGIVLTALANAFGGGEPVTEPVTSWLASDFKARVLEQDEDSLCADAVSVLADRLGLERDGSFNPEEEENPRRRLLLRLVRLGRSRLADDPSVQLILTD